jgi:hypothetical protein
MQAMKHMAVTLANFTWKLMLLEGVLLIIITPIWSFTNWHTIDNYGSALSTVGGIIVGLSLFILATQGGSNDMKLSEAEMEVRSWDHKGQRRFISPYTAGTRALAWLISLGLVTVGVRIVFNIFIP